MKILLSLLLCGLLYASDGNAQFYGPIRPKIQDEVTINTILDNKIPRDFKHFLVLGEGSIVCRDVWQHVCAQLKDAFKKRNIDLQMAFFSSDSVSNYYSYKQLMEQHDFDVVLWFKANGQTNVTRYDGVNRSDLRDGKKETNTMQQIWNLELFTVQPRETIWTASMFTNVIELKERSYRKVSDSLLLRFQQHGILPALADAEGKKSK